MIPGFNVSDSKERLNIPWVCAQIRASYWGFWMTDEMIKEAIRHSLCFGIYRDDTVLDGSEIAVTGEQVGFGRIVTDGVIFSSVTDLLIEQSVRNRGLGTMLLTGMMTHPRVKPTICILGTRDASGFYEKWGFKYCPVPVLQRDPRP